MLVSNTLLLKSNKQMHLKNSLFSTGQIVPISRTDTQCSFTTVKLLRIVMKLLDGDQVNLFFLILGNLNYRY